MACEAIGIAAMILGGGRVTKDSSIDHSVGIVLKKKVGDPVRKGEVICEIHSNDNEKTLLAKTKLIEAVRISKEQVAVEPLIKGIVDKDGWHKII
jgi:pyrimidine-nucleoside phosphorylase